MAITTTFSASTGTILSTVLLDIGSGADAAAGTAYTITLTAAIFASSASVSLQSGSSVTLAGPYTLIVPAFAVTGTVITDLNFTGTITLNNGVFDNVALTSNNGTIVAGLYTGAVLGTVGDAGDTAINSGTITYGGIYAAIELDSGTVQNGWNGSASALVSGAAGGVLLHTSGLVQNGGTIISSGTTSAAVFLGAGTVDNGQIGDIGAQISGGQNGVEIAGAGVVSNDGTITGVASDAVYLGSGTVTNGEIGDLTALIAGGAADNGVWIGAGIGTVGNFGTITSVGTNGVLLTGGGTLTNGGSSDTAALISGPVDGVVFGNLGSLFNYGTIQANGGGATVIGAFLGNGGTIENLSAASMISGLEWGAVVEGASGSVTNLGIIQGSAASGLGVDLIAGGTVVNGLTTGSTATISGVFDGVRISAGAPGAGAVVENDGTIGGAVGVDFESGPTAATGTLIDNGLIQSTSGTSGYAVVFGAGAERLVLQPAGVFIGRVLGNNAPGSSTTLELAGGTQGTLSGTGNDGGTVTDSAGSFVFAAFGTIALDAGAAWAVSAPGTLDTLNNAGALSISGGLVTVTGSLTNSGSISIASGTLTAATGLLADLGIITVGAGGLLKANGGGITAAGTSDIQVGGGVAAALDVTGAGATVNSNGYRIGIGSSGQGSVLVSQGGTVLAGTPFAADEAIYAGYSLGATGALTVTDPGSRLVAIGQFSVGLGGFGSLLIENQATVVTGNNSADTSEGVDIGQLAGASGNAIVTGTNSLLANTGRFVVGDSGLGSLSIQAGGTVITTPGTVAGLAGAIIANTSTAGGSSVNVTGAGSDWQIGGSLIVGNAGFGALSLSQGATVSAGALDMGAGSSGTGIVSVVGTNTALSLTGNLTVGDQSTGELTILGGAKVSGANANIGGSGVGSPSNVDIEGAGSHLTLTGTVAIGLNGPAVFTLGQNTTLTVGGALVTGINGTFNQSGLVDPPTIVNDGITALSGGAADYADISVQNSGQYTLKNGIATIYTPLITYDANPATDGGTTNGSWVINSAGTLVLNSTTVDNSQVIQFGATNAVLVIGQVPAMNGGTITGTVSPGAANVLPGFAAPIENFKSGDQIQLPGLNFLSDTVVNGNTVTLWSGAGGTGTNLGSLSFLTLTGAASSAQATLAATQIASAVPCFAAGTRIATERGEVAVEDLRVGDLLSTLLGEELAPVIWIGQRQVNCARHPRPRQVWPVRVLAGAFGPGLPHRDLLLSPDHAVYVNEVLIPVKHLINGSTIAQVPMDIVTYYHVELPRHDVLLAEGLPAESYLDVDDRGNFDNGGAVVRMHPDFASRVWEAEGCAELVVTGPVFDGVRQMLAGRAEQRVTATRRRRSSRSSAGASSGRNASWC